ncbi:hypothetical protein [Actinomycetospora chiangmaiensis]|uniref:hypothetical protein n=1 Tax=Actinomycetospora chiangmaiensis TaxID=402650 RepID=UPI0003A7EBC5|nr:hypothetical protein [Actinomycetospora chiangmaiensis]
MTTLPPRDRALPPDRVLAAPVFPPPPTRPGVRTSLRRGWRRTWPWLVALLAVVVVVGAELGLLRGRIATDLARLAAAGAAPTAVPTTGGLPPVPRPAPAAAGDVSGVRLRVLAGPCEPARPCTVAVGVDRRDGTAPTATPWTVVVVDRCRGLTTTSPGATTPPGSGTYGVTTVPLPDSPAIALLAVTDGADRAASAATPVGGGPC